MDLYRTFYEDSEQITGSNNLVYPGSYVTVLGGLQGRQYLIKMGTWKSWRWNNDHRGI